ncbi:MAG: S8 family serine peptidase [Thermoplasmata archaeon]|nr:MAG: S8 family serine peptidase [Thermoplasmata archaeon]
MNLSKITTPTILFLLILSSGPMAIDAGPLPEKQIAGLEPLDAKDWSLVMGNTMREKLLELPPDETMEVIIQFHDRVGASDLDILKLHGIEVLYQYKVLPAVLANGRCSALLKFTGYPELKWLEPNWEIQHDMELSTSVVNASRTWSREIIDVNGYSQPVDGTGVTVVVVDTGIDAGHPDLDYGEKTIINQFLDREGGFSWVEQENTDLYYGHGTHVAGTVAGNGDASAGSRRGVAPGANLIGVTIYNPTAGDYLVGLEWVYEHSRPNSNPYNIRVATNSWHTVETEYDPESALSQIIMKLSYENNVVSTWSAGNEGRTSPEGEEITTSKEGNTPVAVMVAAYERDGSAVTDFSSRGQVGLNHTYPDIGAPGRSIWSTSARRTVISGGTYFGGNTNPYYLAISGTSMSTPHVAGLVALLYQACPSLSVSSRHEDYSGDDDSWWTNPETLIHEAEWIIEASATYLDPSEETGVPAQDNSTGMDGRPIDYAQGYGIVDVEKAVGIALTLERLRAMHPDKTITVADALNSYTATLITKDVEAPTDVVFTEWSGEYSRYNDQFGKPLSAVNQTKHVFAPESAKHVIVDMSYNAVSIDKLTFGDLTFTIDFDMDGTVDYTGTLAPTLGRIKHEEFAVPSGSAGQLWSFDVIGEGFKLIQPLRDRNYVELRIEYTMNLQFVLGAGEGEGGGGTNGNMSVINYTQYPAILAPLKEGSSTFEYTGGTVLVTRNFYDLTKVVYHESPGPPEPAVEQKATWPWILAVIVIIILILLYMYNRRKQPLKQFKQQHKPNN